MEEKLKKARKMKIKLILTASVMLVLIGSLVLSILENERIVSKYNDLKVHYETCQRVSDSNLKSLKHTADFLDTAEHAMNNYKAGLQYCEENKPEFLWIAEDIANANTWEADVYDCTEFSNDLSVELRRHGYKARTVHGYWYDIDGITCEEESLEKFSCKHDWVCIGDEHDTGICIEATGGTIIPHSLYGSYYVFEGEGKW